LSKFSYLILFFQFSFVFSQEINESKFWSSASYKYQAKERVSFSFSQLYRLKEDLNAVDSYITELSSDYEVSKNLNFEIELRYYSKNDNKGKVQGFENLWRYRFALEKEIKLKPIKVMIRLAFQKRTSLDKQNDFKEYLRIRSAFEYSIKNWDWDPYFSVEIIEKTSGDDLQKIRYGIGSSNKLNGSKWTIRYFYQIERFIPKRNYHIFMLKYRYKQKAKSLKKKKSKA
jgi:hypothetical protein